MHPGVKWPASLLPGDPNPPWVLGMVGQAPLWVASLLGNADCAAAALGQGLPLPFPLPLKGLHHQGLEPPLAPLALAPALNLNPRPGVVDKRQYMLLPESKGEENWQTFFSETETFW